MFLRYTETVKILMITNSYPDHAESYRGIFIRKLGHELIRQGLDVIVLTPRVYQRSPYQENDGGIRVHRFWYPSGGRPLGQSGAIPVIPMLLYMLSGLFKAVALIRRERPNVIHGHWIVPTGLIAALAGRLLRVPVVNSAHGMDVRISAHRPVGYLFDLAVALSSAVTVVSEAMKGRPSLTEAATIPCGVDEGFFAVQSGEREDRIISTRSLEPIYDLETLIRAAPLVLEGVPDAKFTVIGSGSQAAMLEALAVDLGVRDRIDFLGRLENADIPGQMGRAKIYVSTSLADGTSISLLEALAAGLLPVVANIDANHPWVKHEQTGFLFKPHDPQDLAENILRAFTCPLGSSSRNEYKDYLCKELSSVSIARKYMIIYKELINAEIV